MQVLVIGQGGREHAIAWQAARTADKVYVAPGNAGTATESKLENIAIAANDIPALLAFAKQQAISLTIVGPEVPLTLGLVDAFTAAGLLCCGPTQACAELEGSKAFAKAFMQEHHIPTASYATFSDEQTALSYVHEHPLPVVIKADGLAAGKGVVIAHTHAEAKAALNAMLSGSAFAEAGRTVVIEEFLRGQEASFIALCDGSTILPLASSQDHKARDNGDKGPNTGGMGAISPAPIINEALEQRILNEIMYPVLHGMQARGTPYRGFLYAGLMIDTDLNIKVLEFNCRLGDPETQVLMLRLQSDLNALCLAACQGELALQQCQWDPRSAVGVVMAAEGYPNTYRKGDMITGLDNTLPTHQKIFHAGTAQVATQIVTQGGRVLCVSALGDDFATAQAQAYQLVKTINWTDCYYRTDIGHKAIDKFSV